MEMMQMRMTTTKRGESEQRMDDGERKRGREKAVGREGLSHREREKAEYMLAKPKEEDRLFKVHTVHSSLSLSLSCLARSVCACSARI